MLVIEDYAASSHDLYLATYFVLYVVLTPVVFVNARYLLGRSASTTTAKDVRRWAWYATGAGVALLLVVAADLALSPFALRVTDNWWEVLFYIAAHALIAGIVAVLCTYIYEASSHDAA